MNAREIAIGLGIAVVAGIIVALFNFGFLRDAPSSSHSSTQKVSNVFVSSLSVDFLEEAGLLYLTPEGKSVPIEQLSAYRIYTDSETIVRIEVISKNERLIGAHYSYGRTKRKGALTQTEVLEVLPGDYINVFAVWDNNIQAEPERLFFKSSEATVLMRDAKGSVRCTFHPYLANEFCE